MNIEEVEKELNEDIPAGAGYYGIEIRHDCFNNTESERGKFKASYMVWAHIKTGELDKCRHPEVERISATRGNLEAAFTDFRHKLWKYQDVLEKKSEDKFGPNSCSERVQKPSEEV